MVETIIIDFSKSEQALYDAVSLFKANPDQLRNHSFSTLTLQREACSSREAVYYTLKKMKEKWENPSPSYTAMLDDLFQKINEVTNKFKSRKSIRINSNKLMIKSLSLLNIELPKCTYNGIYNKMEYPLFLFAVALNVGKRIG